MVVVVAKKGRIATRPGSRPRCPPFGHQRAKRRALVCARQKVLPLMLANRNQNSFLGARRVAALPQKQRPQRSRVRVKHCGHCQTNPHPRRLDLHLGFFLPSWR